MSAVRFEGGVRSRPEPVRLDPSQAAVVAIADGRSAAVLGAPGSGKTTTIVEFVAERVLERGWAPDELLVLTSSRASATRLRDVLALRLDRPTDGPLARTVSSLAFELVGAAARAAGAPVPRLLSGGEQDADLGALLEGHIESGSGPAWPDPLDADVRRLRGFRTELRELMGRATEYGVTPERMRRLGRETDRPEWVAAADFIAEYLTVQGLNREYQYDSAELARFAVAAIENPLPEDRVSRLRLVLVDDLQEATESTVAILRALARRGVAVIAFGDPDVAANAFRGGEPDALGRLGERLGVNVAEFRLEVVHRADPTLRALTNAVTTRIGTAAAGGQRKATAVRAASSDPARPPLATVLATTPAREASTIARLLREEHLSHGVPWNELAVVVRSSALAPGIARALALAEVPTRLTGGGVPLRDDSASRALLSIVEVGIGRVELSPSIAAELLLGPFGGVDPIGLRRLRLALRHEEVAGGGTRQSGELLVEALRMPAAFATLDTPFTKRATRMATTLAALRERAHDSTAEELLWLAWERSGVAADWRDQALGTGIASAEANRNLDGVVALFSSAKRFSERRPDAGVDDFLAELLDSEVPDDVLAPRRADDAVLVTTPSGVVGLEFRTVVVAGLQDGVWPNLRLRGSLLSPHRLVRVVTEGEAPLDERKLVLDDELRMFALAVSRASERVVLAAVVNDDETGSVLFSLVPPGTPTLDTASVVPLTLRGVTGRLRRTLTEPARPEAERREAAATLARLAEAGVVGAGPADWLGLIEPSTTGPLFDGEEVPISPSRLESFEESPLDWFLDTVAGSTSNTAMNVGTILHWAMETATDPTVDAIWAAVESRWDELVFEAPWLAEHQRRATRVLAAGIAEYLRDFRAEGKQLVAAEGRFRFPLVSADGATAMVNGSIDRVERDGDGSVVIVDLKTGTPITSQTVVDAHPQLGIYQLAYREGLLDEFLAEHGEHRPGGAKLLYVKKGIGGKAYREGVQASLDDAGLEGFRARIRQAAIGMAAAGFSGLAEPRSFGPGLAELGLRLARVAEVSGD